MLKKIIYKIIEKWHLLFFFFCGNDSNILRVSNPKFRGVKFCLSGRNNIIELGDSVFMRNVVFEISGNNNVVRIGKNCSFWEGGRIRIEGNGQNLIVGENTNLVNVFFSMGDDGNDVIIGKDCLFSSGVVFRTWDNHSIVSVDDLNRRICYGKTITIEDHVWIGNDVVVLKGVEIGADSIVGTKSVVSKSIPSNSLVVGIPAKVVKKNVSWNIKWLKNEG